MALGALLLLIVLAAGASAVEISAGTIRAFDRNILTVRSEEGGVLTIEAWSGTLPLQNPATDLRIDAGTAEISWDALSFGGEPVPAGRLTLRATLVCADRTTEQAEITAEAGSPLPAAVCCLPGAQRFYPDGQGALRVEVALASSGTYEVSAAPKDRPEEEVWHAQGFTNAKEPVILWWNGMQRGRTPCEPGEYVITARSKICPERAHTATVEILAEPESALELTVTGSLMPADFSDDAAVWQALTAPVAVGAAAEGAGLRIMAEKGARSGYIATVSCRTTGLAVLEICDDGWVKVGAWRQADGFWTEGWVKAEKLRMIRPNDRYGAVVDKHNQTMTIYENGKKLGTMLVSTGYTTLENRSADTHSGVFLMATRMENFPQNGHIYNYPVRIDGANLIHSAGYAKTGGGRDYAEELAALGTKASHGCIRMDPRATEENGGLNAWWVWTHLGHDTKIIVMPEE